MDKAFDHKIRTQIGVLIQPSTQIDRQTRQTCNTPLFTSVNKKENKIITQKHIIISTIQLVYNH